MCPLPRSPFALLLLALLPSISPVRQACADPAEALAAPQAPAILLSERRPVAPSAPIVSAQHPLLQVLQFARDEQAYLRGTVRDFSCRLVKRERIGGFLQDYQYIDMLAREEIRDGDAVIQPMSIFLYFQGPAKVAGRRVLYVEGRNEGKMLVRNGGKHFDYVIVKVDPYGDSARDESLVPITQCGFSRVLGQMIDILERHAQADPTGENTKVERIVGAKVNKRPCTAIRILHTKKQGGMEFHEANVFVDEELHVPVRVDFFEWPTRPNQPPPLLAEYTYTELKLNVNLPDHTFNPAILRAAR